jgi:hypothetical protein
MFCMDWQIASWSNAPVILGWVAVVLILGSQNVRSESPEHSLSLLHVLHKR